jgi:hypothetical protein
MITDMSKERRIILTEVWDRWVNLSNEDFDTWLHTQMNSDPAQLQQHSVGRACGRTLCGGKPNSWHWCGWVWQMCGGLALLRGLPHIVSKCQLLPMNPVLVSGKTK